MRSVLQQALVFVKQHWLLAATLCGWGLHIGIQPALCQTISDREHWINESCPKSLGPSLWRNCVDRERAALTNSRGSDVSTLSPADQRWVSESCPRSLGPSVYLNCVQREVAALRQPGWPSANHLPVSDQKWLNESCPRSLGPSVWRNCMTREIAGLSPQLPPPTQNTLPVRPSQPTIRDNPASTSALNARPLPSWAGDRPPMPANYSARELTPQEIFRAVSETKQKVLKANIERADRATDRCFVKVEGRLNPISAVRRVQDLSVGERVYTIGNPSGLTKTLGEGLVSGLRQRDSIRYVQTSAQISKGSSGGALVDSRGALIGITTFLLKDAQNLNFAIAAEEYWR